MQHTVVITGANRGIGLALAEHYSNRGDNVYALCRSSSAALEILKGVVVIEGIDFTCSDYIKVIRERLIKKLENESIDLLINNAGILSKDTLGSVNYAEFSKQLAVNAVAPLRLSEALVQKLKRESKVVMITSRMGSIADNSSGGEYGYRMSKAALNAAGKSLSIDLREKNICVAIIHPGFVKTDLVENLGELSPYESAKNILARIGEMKIENSGEFIHANGSVLPW
ncbi:MAG: NAD(P)-dependent dehydrogenase (short-subunit alcohol dehydrogenase family) [Flavobacteriales bacterium]|jgi:NAD(P)-dependent dehydrogenase (short-subunit alcohol dehydrogenase family)